jgi:flagellar biogenesis protein FliO
MSPLEFALVLIGVAAYVCPRVKKHRRKLCAGFQVVALALALVVGLSNHVAGEAKGA